MQSFNIIICLSDVSGNTKSINMAAFNLTQETKMYSVLVALAANYSNLDQPRRKSKQEKYHRS